MFFNAINEVTSHIDAVVTYCLVLYLPRTSKNALKQIEKEQEVIQIIYNLTYNLSLFI
jgi:hypothetical protein